MRFLSGLLGPVVDDDEDDEDTIAPRGLLFSSNAPQDLPAGLLGYDGADYRAPPRSAMDAGADPDTPARDADYAQQSDAILARKARDALIAEGATVLTPSDDPQVREGLAALQRQLFPQLQFDDPVLVAAGPGYVGMGQGSAAPSAPKTWNDVKQQMKPETYQRLMEAICKCRDDWRLTRTEVLESAGRAWEALTGKYDGQEWPSALNETHSRQACVANEMNTGSPWRGGRPRDPAFLSEVGFRKDGGWWFDPIYSETGRTTFDGGPIAPGSPQRSLSEARRLGKGNVVVWDHVLSKDGNLPVSYDNTNLLLELKFPGDTVTDNQDLARRSSAVQNKLFIGYAKDVDADCDVSEQERQRERNRNIEKIGESIEKAAPLITPPGGRGPRGRPVVPKRYP